MGATGVEYFVVSLSGRSQEEWDEVGKTNSAREMGPGKGGHSNAESGNCMRLR